MSILKQEFPNESIFVRTFSINNNKSFYKIHFCTFSINIKPVKDKFIYSKEKQAS